MEQQQSQAIAKQQQRPVDLLKTMINADSVQEQFKNALGKHKDAFVASLIDLYTGDKKLQACKPKAVIAEALRAATLNLPINRSLGFAYILVFNNTERDAEGNEIKVPTPTFVPGYKGYEQLAMRTGQYRYINEGVVYEGEFKRSDKLTGMIDIGGEKKSDKVVGYFAYFQLLNNMEKSIYMSVEDMAKYAKRYSPALKFNNKITVPMLVKLANEEPKSNTEGWLGNFNDMGIKTCLRRLLSKHGMLSVEMQQVIASEMSAEAKALYDRNDAIEDRGNSKEIDVDEVDYEEVTDEETGEVKTKAKKGKKDSAPAQPKAEQKQEEEKTDAPDKGQGDGTLFSGSETEGPGY
jgi:recombination protein RecT